MPTRIYSDNYYYSFSCCIFFLYLNLSFVAIFFYLLPDFFLASFSILSPRIIFTSVINKSELWTFFTDCAAAWWCQSYCLLDASTVMSWRCALFCVVALCNGFCCCYASFTGNMGKLMRLKFIRKSYVILLYLNTYKDDCLDFAVITLLWHWLLHYTHFILCVCVCACVTMHINLHYSNENLRFLRVKDPHKFHYILILTGIYCTIQSQRNTNKRLLNEQTHTQYR